MSKFAQPVFPAIFADGQADVRPFDRELISALGAWALNVKAILDKGLSLADNVDAAVVAFTSNGVANTEDAIAHDLGKVPTYFVVADIDKGGVVFRSSTAFTKTHVYVKTTVASAAVKLILL